MNEHTDKNFDNKLTIIKDELIEMSALVEKQLTLAINSIKSKDIETTAEIKGLDLEVDDFERSIRDNCFEILTLHQPVANDLRLVFTAIKVSKEIQRFGSPAGQEPPVI